MYEVDRSNAGAWREPKERGWHKDIGYELQDVIRAHRYDYQNKGEKPDEIGWYACTCGDWEGYWSGFEPHVADYLRAVIVARNLPTKPVPC